MKDLINALKNYGAYSILENCTAHGYCRRAKDNDRSKTVPIMAEHEIIEIVDPTEFMLRHVRFESEKSKKNFINEFYFLIITEKGRLIFELLKWQKESIKAERERITQENYNARKDMAEKLLKAVGMDLSDFTDCED